jgi:hypothetical protein
MTIDYKKAYNDLYAQLGELAAELEDEGLAFEEDEIPPAVAAKWSVAMSIQDILAENYDTYVFIPRLFAGIKEEAA